MKTALFLIGILMWGFFGTMAASALAYDPKRERIPTEEPLPPPPAAVPVLDEEFLRLQESLRQEIETSPYDIAIAVTDLQTGQTVHVKGEEPRLLGCTINFFVLLSVVRDIEQGLYPVEDVDWQVFETIHNSNATTSRRLLIKTGGGNLYEGIRKVDALLGDLGLKDDPVPAVFNHPPGYWWETLDGVFVQNSLTATQVNEVLARLYQGEILTPPWRDYFIEKLTRVKPGLNYLIPAGTDRDRAITGHKNGFYPDPVHGWVDNDIGIVMFEKNGTRYAYAISLYMQEIPTLYEDIWTGQKLSRIVWEYFDTKYQ